MQLEPYIFFDGRCEEALEFYKNAIGGSFDVNRFAGSPMESQVGADWAQKVMHATFKGDGFSFMASDSTENGTRPEGSVALSLAVADAAEGRGLFERLSDGGEITMPYDATFWGGSFGMLVDRFGKKWMVSGGHGANN